MTFAKAVQGRNRFGDYYAMQTPKGRGLTEYSTVEAVKEAAERLGFIWQPNSDLWVNELRELKLRGTPELFNRLAVILASVESPALLAIAAEIEDQLAPNADRKHDFVTLEEVLS